MILDRAEVLRYLGYRGQAADEGVQGLIEEWGEKLLEVSSPRFVDRRVPIGRMDGRLQLGTMSVESRSLQRHLEGCEEAILFAATLGAGVDRLIRQASASAMGAAIVLQACAAALIESYCDEVCEGYPAEGVYPTTRFSPGYGDFSLTHQRELLGILDAHRRIGLSCTDSMMLTPMKSVTAVIGLGKRPVSCTGTHCEMCGQKACAYRRR